MNRTTLARRYAPLAAAIAVQLLLIAVVPSTANHGGDVAATGGNYAAGSGTGGGAGSAGGSSATGAATGDAGAGGTAATGAGGTAGGGGAAGTDAGGTASGGGAGGSAATGDTSHCAGGREFDPSIAYWAPPCVPGKPGAAVANNGGATAQGVTGDTITLVDYVSDYGAEVNAILQAEGLLITYDQAKAYDAAVAKFINDHYVLYGRKLVIKTYQGQCQSVPPKYDCLIPEMDKVVDTYKPLAVYWNTTLCSACYAELARKKTIGFGGSGFSDAFAQANFPYFYTAGESSTRVETAFAEMWCKQMSSVNAPSRKVKWAEKNNPAQDFNGSARRLGVISTNDPDNETTVKEVLEPALAKGCNDKIWHTYFYAQDINTAAQQVAAGIAAMDPPKDPATTVLCLCDPVAPAFLFEGEQDNNYYPENAIATDQGMDTDNTGQSYEDDAGKPSLACPNPKQGCEYDEAFGLSTSEPLGPEAQTSGVKIWQAGGGQGMPPMTALAATTFAENYIMMANLIEAAGPQLTPQTIGANGPKMGSVGGGTSGMPRLAFEPGNGHWTQDVAVVYWDKHKASPYNGKPGTYVPVEGARFDLGKFPSLPDGPPIPYR